MEQSINTIAIIPARGGSKGIPKKNIVDLAGEPLISYTINASVNSKYINKVFVSTDSEEIAFVSEQYGAEIIWRPADISTDESSSESALLHALDFLRTLESPIPDMVAFLQCTSPFTTTEDIDGTIEMLLSHGADSAFAAVDFHYFVWKTDKTNEAIGINHTKTKRERRQDREAQYLEAGSVYAMRTKGFIKNKHRFFGKTVIHRVPESHCFEIDTYDDLLIAEAILNVRNRKG